MGRGSGLGLGLYIYWTTLGSTVLEARREQEVADRSDCAGHDSRPLRERTGVPCWCLQHGFQIEAANVDEARLGARQLGHMCPLCCVLDVVMRCSLCVPFSAQVLLRLLCCLLGRRTWIGRSKLIALCHLHHL